MSATLRKTVPARELPASWREEGRFAPEEPVTVTIEPVAATTARVHLPSWFFGAGRGLFASTRAIDHHLRRQLDA
jgi:hypothetical protein